MKKFESLRASWEKCKKKFTENDEKILFSFMKN